MISGQKENRSNADVQFERAGSLMRRPRAHASEPPSVAFRTTFYLLIYLFIRFLRFEVLRMA